MTYNPVVEVNFEFPKEFLLKFFKEYYPEMTDYTTPEYLKNITDLDDTVPGFKVDEENYFHQSLTPIAEEFCKKYNITDAYVTHFLVVEPNAYLPWHEDGKEATCALNCLLSNDNVPVEFESGEYYYNTALLDVRKSHRVKNGPTQRIIFRISFVGNSTYDEICNKIYS